NNAEGTIQSLNSISSFSPFTLASTGPSNPLPVRFVSFDARLNLNRTVLVQWTTSSEINNDHFEIERSNDYVNWTRLYSVSTASSHTYTYTDINPAEGYNYYRIKQVDLNGNYLYTETRIVLVGMITEILLRPNPVLNDLDLVLPFSKAVIEIANESGAVIMRRNINTNHLIVPVAQLKAGTYFARITSGDKVYVKKFVKM
ncbi:MAG: T9SS type A sorting domain-containing protein, partial [Flavisolibacter sp.]